jgi:hypothetical protein
VKEDRVIEQLDKMVSTGRVLEDEAVRLRAAQGTPEFETIMGEIRARHAASHLQTAVNTGEMTGEEANQHLERIRQGEHPKGLRARLRKE